MKRSGVCIWIVALTSKVRRNSDIETMPNDPSFSISRIILTVSTLTVVTLFNKSIYHFLMIGETIVLNFSAIVGLLVFSLCGLAFVFEQNIAKGVTLPLLGINFFLQILILMLAFPITIIKAKDFFQHSVRNHIFTFCATDS